MKNLTEIKNIEYLLEKFELTMFYNDVTETNASYQLQNPDSEQDPHYFRVSYPIPSEDSTEDLTTDINQTISDGIYTAGISNTRSFDIISSDNAMIEKAAIIENLPTAQDSGEYTCASAPMGGDSQTAEEAAALTNEPMTFGFYSYNKQTGAKLYVIGSDSSIDGNEVTVTTYGTRMLTLFSNTWLYDSDVDMGIGTKINSYDTMHFSSAEEAESVLRIFTIAPIVLAVIGVFVWLKRRYA